jgi:hypothetical protein
MGCTVVGSICLRVGERQPYGVNLTKFCSVHFEAEEVVALNETVRPVPIELGGGGATGFEYKVTRGGQTGAFEPNWPIELGETVESGSVEFTTQAVSTQSLAKSIDTSTWITPTGIDAEDSTTLELGGEVKTAVFLSATAVVKSGQVINRVTFDDGHVEDFVFKVVVK